MGLEFVRSFGHYEDRGRWLREPALGHITMPVRFTAAAPPDGAYVSVTGRWVDGGTAGQWQAGEIIDATWRESVHVGYEEHIEEMQREIGRTFEAGGPASAFAEPTPDQLTEFQNAGLILGARRVRLSTGQRVLVLCTTDPDAVRQKLKPHEHGNAAMMISSRWTAAEIDAASKAISAIPDHNIIFVGQSLTSLGDSALTVRTIVPDESLVAAASQFPAGLIQQEAWIVRAPSTRP